MNGRRVPRCSTNARGLSRRIGAEPAEPATPARGAAVEEPSNLPRWASSFTHSSKSFTNINSVIHPGRVGGLYSLAALSKMRAPYLIPRGTIKIAAGYRLGHQLPGVGLESLPSSVPACCLRLDVNKTVPQASLSISRNQLGTPKPFEAGGSPSALGLEKHHELLPPTQIRSHVEIKNSRLCHSSDPPQ
ncbi:hypothetical protein LA080_011842 [Diaporthe eres]|nr:hypothetical protein LA080_011842 [Diaporthe eres]